MPHRVLHISDVYFTYVGYVFYRGKINTFVFMNTDTEKTIHQGRNIKRIREMLGIKQETLADKLNMNQQKVSLLEQKETIEPNILQEIASALKVPVEAIKNFDEQGALNIISNTFTSQDTSTLNAINYYPTFNAFEKYFEVIEENKKLYERLLQSEKEKVEMLQRLLDERKS